MACGGSVLRNNTLRETLLALFLLFLFYESSAAAPVHTPKITPKQPETAESENTNIGAGLLLFLLGNSLINIYLYACCYKGCSPEEAPPPPPLTQIRFTEWWMHQNRVIEITRLVINKIENIDQSPIPGQDEHIAILDNVADLIETLNVLPDDVKIYVKGCLRNKPSIKRRFEAIIPCCDGMSSEQKTLLAEFDLITLRESGG